GAHAPAPHPAARHGAGDRLPDRGGGEHEARRAVGVEDALDVDEEPERDHPAGEARHELRGDDPGDSRGAQQLEVGVHSLPSLVGARSRGEEFAPSGAPPRVWKVCITRANLCTSVDDTPTRYRVGPPSGARYIVVTPPGRGRAMGLSPG